MYLMLRITIELTNYNTKKPRTLGGAQVFNDKMNVNMDSGFLLSIASVGNHDSGAFSLTMEFECLDHGTKPKLISKTCIIILILLFPFRNKSMSVRRSDVFWLPARFNKASLSGCSFVNNLTGGCNGLTD